MKRKISIIIPVHNEGDLILKVVKEVKKQSLHPYEIILVDDCSEEKTKNVLKRIKGIKLIKNKKNMGLSNSLNKGIKKSSGETIVILLADCIPSSKDWLKDLIKPFDGRGVVATGSKVTNPKEIFNKQEVLVRDLLKEERGEYIPELDEKGCAYRRDILFEVGLFDEKHFRTAGEDFDMNYKIKQKGIVKFGASSVYHIHPLDLEGLYKRYSSYARGFGVLFRIYGTKIDSWKGAVLRAFFPGWAIAKTCKMKTKSPKRKIFFVNLKLNWLYMKNFFKSFIKKRQW